MHFIPQLIEIYIFHAASVGYEAMLVPFNKSRIFLSSLSWSQTWRAASLIWEPTGVSEERAGVLFLSVRVGVLNPPQAGVGHSIIPRQLD